ncbi:MAG TPA: choice-of-anchor L domain-containing protein [Flavobacteriales bacterium]|jgi:hypothetical protein|nr:choice-of-anchor L domain-containing protein [Flavobacteriales bacterium]|tara:strand:- start:3125 stop:4663 length:1539 start_codon:yes stop_codon:yes gene_type:complete
MKKSFCLLIFIFLISSILFAQVQINTSGNYSNSSYLIDNAFIGNGVVTSNHSFSGDPSQIGFFHDSLGLIGMDSGFVLTTGIADSIDNLTNPFIMGTDLLGFGDPDLLTIANSVPALIGQTFTVISTADAVILEFDFVPSSDTVRFKYVFASEEYLTFVNTQYNDVFAFLVSGPGITGPYSSPINFPNGAINIANIPNLSPTLPITVSTVNNLTNSQYYNNDSLSIVSAFNGFTDVFTAQVSVIPCETYHIKLAIADGSDGVYDSGVFFEAGSFNSTEPGSPNVQVITTDVLLCNGDSSGTATICVQGGVAPYVINWSGVNPNALSAGTYTVTVTDAVGNVGAQNFIINEPTAISSNITQAIFDLEANAMGGTPNYTYQWLFANILVGTNATYTPTQNGNYYVIVTDANGCVDTSLIFTVTNVISGINEQLSSNLMVYPNPFSQNTTIRLLNKKDELLDLSLFDSTGKKVKGLNYYTKDNTITIERGNLTKGIYLLVVKTRNYTSKSKLVID